MWNRGGWLIENRWADYRWEAGLSEAEHKDYRGGLRARIGKSKET